MLIFIVAIVIILYLIIDIVYLDYFKYKRYAAEAVDDIESRLESNTREIKDLQARYQKEFTCPKCSGKDAESDVLCLQSKEYSKISSKKPHKFLKVSCKKCGYTETYNLNLYYETDNVDALPLDDEKYGTFFKYKDMFVCPKCSNKKGDAKSVYVRRRGMSRLVNFQLNELIVLTCMKCYYSLFFDDEIVFEHHAEEKEHKEL